MEKFLQNLQEADRMIKAVDHLAYITFPIVKDKKMLLKILVETKNAIALCINSILQYDYIFKKIRLYRNTKENFRTFREKCASRYGIKPEEVNKITNLFSLVERHQKSPFEFVRNDKVIIMSEGFHPESITIEQTKEFVALAKNLFFKVENSIRNNHF